MSGADCGQCVGNGVIDRLPRDTVSLRYTYASFCVAAGIKPIDIAELMGHRDVKRTLTVYSHLINTDDHAGDMAALGALGTPAATPTYGGNVIPLHG
jgi:hypothetical protein